MDANMNHISLSGKEGRYEEFIRAQIKTKYRISDDSLDQFSRDVIIRASRLCAELDKQMHNIADAASTLIGILLAGRGEI